MPGLVRGKLHPVPGEGDLALVSHLLLLAAFRALLPTTLEPVPSAARAGGAGFVTPGKTEAPGSPRGGGY